MLSRYNFFKLSRFFFVYDRSSRDPRVVHFAEISREERRLRREARARTEQNEHIRAEDAQPPSEHMEVDKEEVEMAAEPERTLRDLASPHTAQ